jgi:hypothetical protein
MARCLSDRPCLKPPIQNSGNESAMKPVGRRVPDEKQKGTNSIPFPISFETVWFSLDVWSKQFRILAVSRF